ncbi:egf domain-specific o-linked n-acetylglucosamine transferase [Anaeramoeba ignava]|uniref:EGF domain-specific O-linked N-acetylglucosamine transferase n=1 Tax=Anaeramoeba ignava TaxID=1746090 RepID=A0A9Q0RCX2_ANAIG|nr:egf domain-specific o-linked n-acetylglucosamine transferase [Anaeramoeba ignava]
MHQLQNLPLFVKTFFVIFLIGQIIIFLTLNSKWMITKENDQQTSKEIQIIKQIEIKNKSCETKIEFCECEEEKKNSSTDLVAKLQEIENKLEMTKQCSSEYGYLLIKNWQESRIDICSGSKLSQVSCYKRENPGKHILCTGKNVEIKGYEPFFKAGNTAVPTRNNVHFGGGFLTVDCSQALKNWVPSDQWEHHVSNVIGNMISVPEMNCDHWVDDTVMLIFRWDQWNSYHALEDYITAFISLLILNEDPQKIQLVFTDDMPPGAQVYDFWSYYFAKEPIFLRDGKFPQNTCFKKAIFGMWAQNSILSIDFSRNWSKNCRSSIILLFKKYILPRFNISIEDNVHKPPYTIAFVKREDYQNKNIARKITNHDEIFKYIERKLPKDWSIVNFQPEKLTIEEQIQMSSRFSIIIGPHGAAFTYVVFFPEKSHLIEIFMGDRGSINVHFKNLCVFMGHHYHNAGHFSNNVPPETLWNIVESSIKEIEKLPH